MIFNPLIEVSRDSFFDFPRNLSNLISFFNQLISYEEFYKFFISTDCSEFPFIALSIISSDTAHNVPEYYRQKFDTEFISNCLTLIGNYFNHSYITESNLIEESVSRLLFSLSRTQLQISDAAIDGIIKGVNIIPEIIVDQMFSENIFENLFPFFEDENPSSSLEKIQINILKIFKKIIQSLNITENSIAFDESFFGIIQKQLHRSAPFQVAALKVLNSLSNPKKLQLFDLLSGSIPSLIELISSDISFEVKNLCFKFLISFLEISNHQFIINNMAIFDAIVPVLTSLSFDEMVSFAQLIASLLKQFSFNFDNSLKIQLLNNGTIDELNNFLELAEDENEIIQNVIELIES